MAEAMEEVRAARPRRFRPYPEYRDSGVEWFGEVPVDWDTAPVYARYRVELGKMLDAKRDTGENSGPYLRNVDVQWDQVNTNDLPTMDFCAGDRERYGLRSGDILVCEGGEVGRTAIWQGDLDPCFYQKALHRVRPVGDRDVSRFFYYVMYGAAQQGVFVAGGNPNTIDHLTAVQLRHYRFPFPSTDEQRAIASFLDRETAKIDGLVAKKERLLELLQEKRTALITRAVTQGLDPNVRMKDSGIEWLGKIPAHWDLKPLKYLIDAPLAYGVLKPDKYEGDDGVLLIRILDVEMGEVNEHQVQTISPEQSAEYRRTVVNAGDLILSVVGTIGRCFVVPRSLEGANLSRALARIQLGRMIEARFLEYSFAAEAFRAFVDLIPAGTAQKVLNLGDLAEFVVPLPDVGEQREIVSWLDQEVSVVDSLARRITDGVDRLKEFRTALISAAVTGKIDVRGESA